MSPGMVEFGDFKMSNKQISTATLQLNIIQGSVTGQYYRDYILAPIVVHAGWHIVFQDDNAHAHRECIVNDHLN